MKNFNVYFWNGTKYKIPLCCIFFFITMLSSFSELNKKWYEHGDGYIRCPDCIIRELQT